MPLSASWTLLSTPTKGCPRNRLNSMTADAIPVWVSGFRVAGAAAGAVGRRGRQLPPRRDGSRQSRAAVHGDGVVVFRQPRRPLDVILRVSAGEAGRSPSRSTPTCGGRGFRWVTASPSTASTSRRVVRDFGAIVETAQRLGATLYVVYLPTPAEIYVPLLEAAEGRNQCAQSCYERYARGAFDFDRAFRAYRQARLCNARERLHVPARAGDARRAAHRRRRSPTVLGQKRIAEAIIQSVGLGTRM
jgi:hypothetical protein